ncbi:MAG: ABC transporter ATP-binding protein [Candidatus Sumerlaeota bacterium]|nr:ABC transporter ATP-binding protein [Candidatus Sumerlaeota bacterium]
MPADPNSPAIHVAKLTKSYATARGPVEILRGVDLSVCAGQSVAIMGPSGSGKSTLLHILGTLDRPSSGSVLLSGRDPFALADKALADFRNREIGFVFQEHYLLPQCTALENALVPALVSAADRRQAAERARRLLERVGLAGLMDSPPAMLSGGERQRVAIARALINRPHILLCDEPTGALDQATGEAMADLLREIQRDEAVALVAVTHNESFARRFDRLLRLKEGKLMEA